MLDAGNAQARHSRPIDGTLPSGKLLDGKVVTIAYLVDGQQTAIDGSDHLRLATHHPTGRARRRKRIQRKRLAERADYLSGTYLLVLDHHLTFNLAFATFCDPPGQADKAIPLKEA